VAVSMARRARGGRVACWVMVSLQEKIRRTWLVAVKRRAHHDDRAPSPPDDVRWNDGGPAPFKLYLRLYRPKKKLLDSTIGRRQWSSA
jgi:hypothetical protein